jgi:hypothetical protein
MKDDYLWDGTGEPDPEVEHLERVLSRHRYRPRELRLPERPQTAHFFRYAVAASLALAVLAAGLWLGRPRQQNEAAPSSSLTATPATTSTPAATAQATDRNPQPEAISSVRGGKAGESGLEPKDSGSEFTALDLAPMFDLETVRHLERTQMLLRSFKNAALLNNQAADEIAYEKQWARDLLITNILLRRDAETERNLPAEQLLSTLEPFLLDIANLQDNPSHDDVRSIQQRIREREIIAALQVYSPGAMNPTL